MMPNRVSTINVISPYYHSQKPSFAFRQLTPITKSLTPHNNLSDRFLQPATARPQPSFQPSSAWPSVPSLSTCVSVTLTYIKSVSRPSPSSIVMSLTYIPPYQNSSNSTQKNQKFSEDENIKILLSVVSRSTVQYFCKPKSLFRFLLTQDCHPIPPALLETNSRLI